MRIAVVDAMDNRRMAYITMILKLDPYAEITECISAEDALFAILDQPVDVIICAEFLPLRSAFELSRLLKKLTNQIPVVVISSDQAKAMDAIKNEVFAYLMDPITIEKLQTTFAKLIQYHNQKIRYLLKNQSEADLKIKMNTIHGYKLVPINELAYCEADGAYTVIVYSNGSTELSSYNLGRIARVLEDFHFIRVSRSCMVNSRKIEKIDRITRQCLLRMDMEYRTLKISRKQIDLLEEHQIL